MDKNVDINREITKELEEMKVITQDEVGLPKETKEETSDKTENRQNKNKGSQR